MAELLTGCPAREVLVTCVSELSTNAITHTASGQGGGFTVEVDLPRDGVARIAVTDDGGIAVVPVKVKAGKDMFEIEAKDPEGNLASSKVELEAREGEDQILLRTERAVYRTGERIQLKVFSTKARGAAYVDIVKEGQTVLTRDLDLENGEAELSLAATPEMALE